MAIPKYITHPLLLVAFGLAVGSFVWIKLPSQQTLETTKIQVQNAAIKPAVTANDLIAISDFSTLGCLTLGHDTADLLCLDDTKLRGLSPESFQKMQIFFKDKWIHKNQLSRQSMPLPLEIWDTSCIAQGTEIAPSNLCPMVLSP